MLELDQPHPLNFSFRRIPLRVLDQRGSSMVVTTNPPNPDARMVINSLWIKEVTMLRGVQERDAVGGEESMTSWI